MGKYRLTMFLEFEADDDPSARKIAAKGVLEKHSNLCSKDGVKTKLQAIYDKKQPRQISLDIK